MWTFASWEQKQFITPVKIIGTSSASQTYCTTMQWDLRLGWLFTTAFAFKSLSLELALPVRSGKPISTGFGASVKWTLHNLGADGILMACDGDWSQMHIHMHSRSPLFQTDILLLFFPPLTPHGTSLTDFFSKRSAALIVRVMENRAFIVIGWLKNGRVKGSYGSFVILWSSWQLHTEHLSLWQVWWLGHSADSDSPGRQSERLRGVMSHTYTHTHIQQTVRRNMFFSFTWHTWRETKGKAQNNP